MSSNFAYDHWPSEMDVDDPQDTETWRDAALDPVHSAVAIQAAPKGQKRPPPDHYCDICELQLARNSTLLRHQRSIAHLKKAGQLAIKFPCTYDGCPLEYAREDSRKRHVIEVHLGKRRGINDAATSTSREADPWRLKEPTLTPRGIDLDTSRSQPWHLEKPTLARQKINFDTSKSQ